MKVIVIVTKDFIKHVKYLVKFVDENCVDEIIEDSRLEEAVFKLSTELKMLYLKMVNSFVLKMILMSIWKK